MNPQSLIQTVSRHWRHWLALQARAIPVTSEPPLRAELYSREQLARHAKALAANHRVVIRPGADRLLPRLHVNEEILHDFNRATLAVERTRRVTPAAEWLLDNFYLIEEQIQMARRHLPRHYSRELPRLGDGPSAGLPRVYDIVLELIAHVDAQIDAGPLAAFIADYQTVTDLKLGELWAIPIMLRLGLIENLQRITTRLRLARQDRDQADAWVDRLQAMAERSPSHLVVVVADMAKAELPLTSSFVAEFCRRLSRQNPVLHLARSWLEHRLLEQGLSIDQLVHLDNQNQSADQVSVSHSIASLRFLSAMDWKEFVETLSVVEATLRSDPAGVYGMMDFSTRDRYRHMVEFLSRNSRFSEVEVAQKAIELAGANIQSEGGNDRIGSEDPESTLPFSLSTTKGGESRGEANAPLPTQSPSPLPGREGGDQEGISSLDVRKTKSPSGQGTMPHSNSDPGGLLRDAEAQASQCGLAQRDPAARSGHVGFYLIDHGQEILGRALKLRHPWRTISERWIHRFPLTFYGGCIGLLTALATIGFILEAQRFTVAGALLIGFTVIFVICASQMAVAVMNWVSTLLVKPVLLPRMDYSFGIPSDCHTMVVVPTMLTSLDGVDRLLESLEIHQLANRDPQLQFALLTDFRDAPEAIMPGDAPLLDWARAGIERLNLKYPAERQTTFFLFHRPRRWNDSEGLWMGYERKRGKLTEFNAMLRGGSRDSFSLIVGDTAFLSVIKYVITLDTDTQLPRGAARQLVGILSHPLNRPQFDPGRGIVTAGYGILQPRVGVSLPSASRSWFVRLFAGDAGIDPYTRAVSDVYQDLFKEGSFIGKGIYDVDTFQRAMNGRFPENTVLSHDLLEACHARSALVSDVEFYEEHPSRYNTDADRRHRWIRGDWQITQWLLPRVPGPDARRVVNPLSGLSQWKIFDNLRRSLVPVALQILLPGLWLLLPDLGGAGTLFVLAIIMLPGGLAAGGGLLCKPEELPWSMHLRAAGSAGGRQLGQIFLTLAFLPYDAFMSLDAIGRTLMRLLVTHKRLLEWETSGDSERSMRADLAGFYATMWIAPVLAAGVALLLAALQPAQLGLVWPVLGMWVFAPGIAWWISQPIEPSTPNLTVEQLDFLRHTARKTWHYFETFVTARENWLPPDNFQEEPIPVIATRTSPTNLGLALLANLGSYDLGYLPASGLVRRTQDTLAAMEKLERHRGHFYNWYATRTLLPLPPLYISSVDSGNLAGHLLTLASGLRELEQEKILHPRVFAGLRDTVRVLRGLDAGNAELAQLDAELAQSPTTLRPAHELLERAANQASKISTSLASQSEEIKEWGETLKRNCEEHLEELRFLAPWLASAEAIPRMPSPDNKLAALEHNPTLSELSLAADSFKFPASRPHSPAAIAEGANFSAPTQESPHAPPGDASTLPASASLPSLEPAECQTQLSCSIRVASERAHQRLALAEALAVKCDDMAAGMDFTFLFDTARDLFSIGWNVSEHRCDPSFYDLLASEARLCSYVAIALGQVPQDHWFSMGRLLVASRGEPILVSWSGSMFEYLMPLLVMPNYENTLLDHTCKEVVRQQIAYGKLHGVPWGISESGYHRTDAQLNYQYRAFGVPGLGLKRGLGDDLVIAPYATAMALIVAPQKACENLQRLANQERAGAYGFFEAVDYTPSRLPPGQKSVTIRSFMAHHQGMSLVSLVNLLCDQPMPRRFLACPLLKAADLLLQERVPNTAARVLAGDLQLEGSRTLPGTIEEATRVLTNPSAPAPEVHLLSNGSYHVAISSAGGGYSRWRDLAVTRWREDSTRDCWGLFVYLRDTVTGEFWSTSYQPTLRATKTYEAIFTQARAEFCQRHAGLKIHTEISVSAEDDVELRRITITNRSSVTRVIELTSYAEVVLARPDADVGHPAFSNLFVQTEFLQKSSAILCTRRPRSQEDQPPWLLHLMVGHGGAPGTVSCETDRFRFVGRGGSLANPAAMQASRPAAVDSEQTLAPLSNTVGAVLDPIIALRRTVTLAANESAIIDLVLGVTEKRESALAHVEKYQSPRMADRAFDLAWTHSQVTLHHLDITEAEAQLYGRLAGALIYADPAHRANPGVLRTNRRGQNGLWSYGISGDAPIVLLRISDAEKIELVRQLIQAHSYWRMKGLTVELVIVNEDVSVYRQPLQDQITSLIASGIEAQMLEKPGGIFVRRFEQVPHEDLVLLQSVARIVVNDENGTLAEQLGQRIIIQPAIPMLKARHLDDEEPAVPLPPRDLIFKNGFGGFTRDGHEYVITLGPGQMTPAPWVNVLGNPFFGTVISESGAAYTWVENSHEFRLTPWSNDPVQDPTGEALYIRDDETGQVWSPTPLPARGATSYVIRHGFGYSVFEHTENGIASELWVYVAMDAPVKFSVLKLHNGSGRARRLSVTSYSEWVLGDLRHKSLLHVQTEVDVKTGALLARNFYNTEFPERIAFIDVNDATLTLTGDRREFIGRNGSLAQPAALKRTRLSGRVGAGLDPCGAVQVTFNLPAGQDREATFRLGVGRNAADVQNLIRRFRREDASQVALQGVWDYWNRTLGTVSVETPDPAVNVMANGWLLYQTLSCRVWARTGFYQSGGAYGFRDQLQDVMALVHAEPAITREHLLRAAAHQFGEGDVQHWWHPPGGRGVRTHSSDDYLWLPHATCRYVTCVADTGVLDEKISFLEARPVKPEEEAYYDLPNRSEESATLYQHCVRAIERGLKFGEHGLPLMGCGDWNDGMNMVGKEGRGESVWLAFFLYDVLNQFSTLARGRKDFSFADRCDAQALQLHQNIERHAWDGAWYLRAYQDNGEPLGSAMNPECQIDSLPQSWSVISGAGAPQRARQAMESVDERLVHRNTGLIQLFDPPFDRSSINPGYIKGYIPGVRENGGQYTHAAVWTVMAFALQGDHDRAWELFGFLNPINHGATPEQISTYKVEPYVVAADVYAVPPHTGRGGWTWYTGAAGWMYRLLVETLLGVNLEGDQLRLTPRLPKSWTSFKINYRFRQTPYRITVVRLPAESPVAREVHVDGQQLATGTVPLVDDHKAHVVLLKLR